MQSIQFTRVVVAAALAAFTLCPFATAAHHDTGNMWVTSVAQAPNGGYWIQVNDTAHTGKTIVSGAAPVFDSVNAPGTIVAVPGKIGYWVVTKRGDIVSRGDAPVFCEGHLSKCSNYPSDPGNKNFVMHAAATPDGLGLWVLGYDGQVWTVGTAQPYGDRQGEDRIYGSAIVPTPSGKGYYILMSDGGVHTRGDAVFFGSTGGDRFVEYTGMVLSKTAAGAVNGYWLLAEDGGVFTYGDAVLLGSTGGNSKRVTSMFSVDGGTRYGWVTYNGTLGFSNSYRRGPVTTPDYDLSPVWTMNGVDKLGAEMQVATLGSGRVDSWIFWPTKWAGTYVNQIRNERNGLCLEVSSDVLVLAACQPDMSKAGTQAFWLVDGPNGSFWVVWAVNPQYFLVKGDGPRLKLLLSGNGLWRTLDVTTVTSEATRAQWQTGGAVGSLTTLGVPNAQTPRQNWVVAATSSAPGSTVRFISMETGYCGEFKMAGGVFDTLFQSACQMAVPRQTFRLAPDGVNTYRINIAFHDSVGAAPASKGGVWFTQASQRWILDAPKLP